MLVYVAGPYTAKDGRSVDDNIEAARAVAVKLWEKGHAVICPHQNTANFELDCKATYEDYLRGDLVMLARCDAIVMVEGWEDSAGAVKELAFARDVDMPVYFAPDLPELHPTEVRCPQQVRAFGEFAGIMLRTHLRKNADYGSANMALTGQIGLAVRLWDKVGRMLNLMGFELHVTAPTFTGPKKAANESLVDTCLDTGTYGGIGWIMMRGEWGK